jgi:hypothetical protein
MNISLPPKEPCSVLWPKFVEWLVVKMEQDAWMPGSPSIPLYEIAFRAHKLTYCPFCGMRFNMYRSIWERHSPVEEVYEDNV